MLTKDLTMEKTGSIFISKIMLEIKFYIGYNQCGYKSLLTLYTHMYERVKYSFFPDIMHLTLY